MNLTNLRAMIRLSLKSNIISHLHEKRKIPKSLNEFLRHVALLEQHDISFSELYELWQNLHLDTAGLKNNELIFEWNSSLEYHVNLLDCCEDSKNNLINHLKK